MDEPESDIRVRCFGLGSRDAGPAPSHQPLSLHVGW
jgi:hypothetical protein